MKKLFTFSATLILIFVLSPISQTEPHRFLRNDGPSESAALTDAAEDTSVSARETREKFDPARDPSADVATATKITAKENKKILLDVGGEWCIWCHKLDKFFEDNKDVSDFLHANYIVVKVNYSKENKNEKFLSAFPEIKGYPHLFVLDNNGKLLHSQDTGDLESGNHHDHDKVLKFLKAWAT